MIWILIYNDGTNITTARSDKTSWNQAPTNNVQFQIFEDCGQRQIFSGQNEYSINEPNTNRKFGSQISNQEFKKTREFMIYGDY